MLLAGDGVSASFGGYHASAGLGGSLDGGPAGALFAEAGTPDGTGASAGLGGAVGSGGFLLSKAGVGRGTNAASDSSAASSAEAGSHVPRPTKQPADFYDNVFNVSSLLQDQVNLHVLSVLLRLNPTQSFVPCSSLCPSLDYV